MPINKLQNTNSIKSSSVNPNLHKSLADIKKEQKQTASIFAQEELARLTGEHVNSDIIQNVLKQSSESTNINELLGVYLSESGKAASAKYTDEKGNEQTVSINDLTTDELKTVASGVSNPLASRNKENTQNTDNKKTNTTFGKITNSHGLKTIKNIDDSQEFISTMKEISDEGPEISEETKDKAKNEQKVSALQSSEISKSNGYQCIAEAENRDKTIQTNILDIKQETNQMKTFCANKASKNNTLHNRNESLNNKNGNKKINKTGNFLTATSKTNNSVKNIVKPKAAQKTTIKENSKFLGITGTKTSGSNNVTNPMSSIKASSTSKITTSNKNSNVTEKINNNIDKTNSAANILKENDSTLQDTSNKAIQAKEYTQISKNYQENSIKAASSADNNKSIMLNNAKASAMAAQEYSSNSTETKQLSVKSENEAISFANESQSALESSKELKKQSSEQISASKTVTKNAMTELANVSVSDILANAALDSANNSINATKEDFSEADRCNNKGDNYKTAADALTASVAYSPLALIFYYHADRLHDKSDDIRNVANIKLNKAKSEQAAAQAKINDIQEQKEKAQEDIQSGKALEKLSKGSLKKSKEEKEKSLESKIQSSVKSGEKTSYQNISNNANKLSKEYDGNAKLQASIAQLNQAFVSRETTNANEYGTKAASQNNTAIKLENIVNNQTSKQNTMVQKLNEAVDNNNAAVKKINNSDKNNNDKNVEKFEKENGAEETNKLSSNNINKTQNDNITKAAATFNNNGAGIGALDIFQHNKVDKPKMIFGLPQLENQNDEKQETDNSNNNTENDENISQVNNNNENQMENNQQTENNNVAQASISVQSVDSADVKKVQQI